MDARLFQGGDSWRGTHTGGPVRESVRGESEILLVRTFSDPTVPYDPQGRPEPCLPRPNRGDLSSNGYRSSDTSDAVSRRKDDVRSSRVVGPLVPLQGTKYSWRVGLTRMTWAASSLVSIRVHPDSLGQTHTPVPPLSFVRVERGERGATNTWLMCSVEQERGLKLSGNNKITVKV